MGIQCLVVFCEILICVRYLREFDCELVGFDVRNREEHDVIMSSDSEEILFKYITSQFAANIAKTLAGKPKLFFVQVGPVYYLSKTNLQVKGTKDVCAKDYLFQKMLRKIRTKLSAM